MIDTGFMLYKCLNTLTADDEYKGQRGLLGVKNQSYFKYDKPHFK